MKYSYCFYGETKVVDSRESENGSFVRKGRKNVKCGKRFMKKENIRR
ncbi:MAG: hypothetical protein KAT49_04845 [Methanomicrobia archaeon]|nr:hypothetical protein [Methanomicrobia archaeon]